MGKSNRESNAIYTAMASVLVQLGVTVGIQKPKWNRIVPNILQSKYHSFNLRIITDARFKLPGLIFHDNLILSYPELISTKLNQICVFNK